MKVPNSSSKHSPVRPREAKPRIAVAGGTHGKVAVQPAAQEQHTGPREKHIEGRRGAAHGGKRGEKVDVLDKGGARVRKRWRVRGVAGEARTGTRLLEDSDRALAGNHPSSVCRKKPRRRAGEEGDAGGHVTFHDASAGVQQRGKVSARVVERRLGESGRAAVVLCLGRSARKCGVRT